MGRAWFPRRKRAVAYKTMKDKGFRGGILWYADNAIRSLRPGLQERAVPGRERAEVEGAAPLVRPRMAPGR